MTASGKKNLFGTDGIRGKANEYPITCELAMQAGIAIGQFVEQQGKKNLIIGRDTRISGSMLESALAAGAASVGVDVLLAGEIPTPGVACLCSHIPDAGAGAVISASHNPYQDNGIKFFDARGHKLTDFQESVLEEMILGKANGKDQGPERIGSIQPLRDGHAIYADFLLNPFCFDKTRIFDGRKLSMVLDAANGAASSMMEEVFSRDCFSVTCIHHEPDGYNINKDCGSQYTDSLQKKVLETKADIGLALDGDADRLIALDEQGNEISGDAILAICAAHAKEKGRLKNSVLVSTIMSNIGLSHFLESLGISHVKTRVGDRNVFQGMQETGAVLGGENSGHVIFSDYHTTGDGMFCALKLLDILLETQKPLSELARVFTSYPQILENVTISDASRPDVNQIPEIARVIDQVKENLGKKGRVLIRYSGTQPLLRVMVEGQDRAEIQKFCREICQAITNYFA